MDEELVIIYKNFTKVEQYYTEINFEIKTLGDMIYNSGSQLLPPILIDENLQSQQLNEYFNSNNATLLNFDNIKLSTKTNNSENPYFKICEDEDFKIIQEIPKESVIITNDYGLFYASMNEGLLLPIYKPIQDQLIRGPTFFFQKKFLKEINNRKWKFNNN